MNIHEELLLKGIIYVVPNEIQMFDCDSLDNPLIVTYRVPGPAPLLTVPTDWPGVQALLVPQLAGRLDGLTELAC